MVNAIVRLEAADLAWLRSTGPDGTAWLVDHPRAFELEEALSGVHFLLTGTEREGEGPLGFLANPSFGESVPHGASLPSGRIIEPAAVSAIADAIESLSVRDVRPRLMGAALAALPPFAGRPLTEDDQEWLLAVLQGVMTFVRRAATDGVPLLVTTAPGP